MCSTNCLTRGNSCIYELTVQSLQAGPDEVLSKALEGPSLNGLDTVALVGNSMEIDMPYNSYKFFHHCMSC